jgi:cysteinyl-tRNA synthetase
MHNGFVQMEGEKMAKSEGNVVTIKELLVDWPGEAIKLAMLQTHYRQPINWTAEKLRQAYEWVDRWYSVLGDVPADGTPDNALLSPLLDDLNTWEAVRALNSSIPAAWDKSRWDDGSTYGPLSEQEARDLKATAVALGFMTERKAVWEARKIQRAAVDVNAVDMLIVARNAARKAKNFQESDRIRDELAKMGVVLHDKKDGTTTWEVAR